MKTQRQGQIELNETLLVLFILVLIFAIGMFVYFRFSLARITLASLEFSEQQATLFLASMTRLPEISCDDEDCVDTGKLAAFSSLKMGEQPFYRSLWGYKKISISQAYPALSSPEICTASLYSQQSYSCREWVLYDYQPSRITKTSLFSTPLSFYYPDTGDYAIGLLEVAVYGSA